MAEKIKVLVVDDVADTRDNIVKLMAFHNDVDIVGQAANAEEAIRLAKQLEPDLILMDINMPGMDGIAATEILITEVPGASIIIMSVQGEQEYLKRAMVAGAKNYLTKPFSGDELVQALRQVYLNELRRKKVLKFEPRPSELGKVITVFSTKGGIGKTTIATNLAVTLAAKTGGKVGIIDADLQFGDVSLFLNLIPQATIADLVHDIDSLDDKLLQSYLASYNNNLKVLPAPFRPEQAETISGNHLATIIKTMRQSFKYIIVDTAPSFNETMLAALDAADQVLVISAMDLPTIKNVKLCLEIMENLGYTEEKVKLVLNRANSEGGMDVPEVEESLGRSFAATLPSDGKIVVSSVNRGVPFVVSNPEAIVSQGIVNLARMISGQMLHEDSQRSSGGVVHRLKRLFG